MAYPPNPGSGGGGSSNVHIGPLPPDKPNLKPMWLNTELNKLFYYKVVDGEMPIWEEVSSVEIPDIPEVDNFLVKPSIIEMNHSHVIFSNGNGGTFTNGIKTNQYNQLDINFNRIKNAVIDCGAFYD